MNSLIFKSRVAKCAALRASSNNENLTAVAFQMDDLTVIEYEIFMFFHTPQLLEAKIELKLVECFSFGLVIAKWMKHILRQTGSSSVLRAL
jgi:hypothetical protein